MSNIVVNESNKFSALGRYAKDLTKALDSELITLYLDSSKDIKNFEGKILKPRKILKISNGWYYYHRFPHFSLRKITDEIRKEIYGDTIIHYASQGIPRLNIDNRFVYTIHDLFGLDEKYNSDPKIRKLLIKNLKEVFLAEKILTVSNFIKSKLEALEIPPEVVTIYPPVSPSFKPLADKNKIRKELGLPFDKKLILNVSSNDPRKNLPAVLKTIKLLGDNYELVRIGKRLGEGYSFINVDDTTVNKVYNACDALLFPSLDEGFGYPVVESMTAGLPVVASKIDIFEEIAKDAAFLVNPTPEKLSEAIIRVVSESEKYQKKGFIRSKEFSFENFKLKIKEFYKEF